MKCPSGWSSHNIGTSTKCLFNTKSKIQINQIDKYCQRLNATVPYPKTTEENQNYRDAFDSLNISESVAIKSCHGIVELESTLKWNPFPSKMLVNVVCEKAAVLYTEARFKRQANSGRFTNFHQKVAETQKFRHS